MLATRERTPFPRSLVARLPRLRMFGLTGSRAALIDIAGMIERGITVCYTGGGPSVQSTAELALALMLAAARRIPQCDAAVRAGRFQLGTQGGFILAGKTIGLLGLGRIGAQMAGYCNALGMRVQAWSQNLTDERALAAGATRVAKDELLATSDVVSLHLVISERTRGMLGAAELARMKRGAVLVNTSRGPLVDEAALIEAVQSGHVFAALDVYDREPLRADHPLIRCPNTVLTPHLGYSVAEVYAEYYATLRRERARLPGREADPRARACASLLRITEMSVRLRNIPVVPAQAGTQRLSTNDTGRSRKRARFLRERRFRGSRVTHFRNVR